MAHRVVPYAASAVVLFTAALSAGQAAPAAARPAAAAPAAVPPAAVPSAAVAPSDAGPEAPVGKVTQILLAKLAAMQRGGGLTAEDVARRARENSPEVVAKQRSIAAADAVIDETKSAFYPQLSLQARYTRLSAIDPPSFPGTNFSFPVFLNNYNLQATLSIPLSDYVLRMSAAIAGTRHSRASLAASKEATTLAVGRDARVAYYQWIRAQGVEFVTRQGAEAARGHLVDAQNAFQAGLVSRADVLRAASQVKANELSNMRAGNAVSAATERLHVFMQDRSGQTYEVGENILAPAAPYAVPASLDEAYAEALEHRLEMKELGETEAAIREQARAARAGSYPRLDAQAGATYANPHQRFQPPEDAWHATWDASLVLSWSPTGIFGSQAQSKAAEARADEVAARRHILKNGLRLELRDALNACEEATLSLEASGQTLAAADEGYRVRRDLYRAGKGTLLEVTDAETELTRARLEVVDAHINLRIARVVLEHALGRDVAR